MISYPLLNLLRSQTRILVYLLVREPLARLEVFLLERRIQHAQSPYLSCRGRVVALDVCFGFAVGCLQGKGAGGLCELHQHRPHYERLANDAEEVGGGNMR